MKTLKENWLFGLLLLAYLAISIPQLSRGVGSLDAHGIMQVVQRLANGEEAGVSRPPGHPTTEYYLFGSVAWLIRHFGGRPFSDEVYLGMQLAAGIAGFILFYDLLFRLFTTRWRAAIAAACLAFSPTYLANSFDGEEFLFSIVFVLVAVRLLLVSPTSWESPSVLRISLSMLAFGLATGCRPEAVIAGVMYPLFYWFNPKQNWKDFAVGLSILGLFTVAIWLPVILSKGISPPTGSGMNTSQSVLGAGYKLLFVVCPLPVSLLLVWSSIRAGMELPVRLRASSPRDCAIVICFAITICFVIFFIRRSDKPAYFLCALPFTIALALQRSDRVLLGISVFTAIGCAVGLDIFNNRVMVPPYFTEGAYLKAVSGKPPSKLDYLRYISSFSPNSESSKAVVVANAWPWDFEYHMRRGELHLREELIDESEGVPSLVLRPVGNDSLLIATRQPASNLEFLRKRHAAGYEIWMDRRLFRTLFQKHNITDPLHNEGSVDGIPVRLF